VDGGGAFTGPPVAVPVVFELGKRHEFL
jgi:hypothetical protein